MHHSLHQFLIRLRFIDPLLNHFLLLRFLESPTQPAQWRQELINRLRDLAIVDVGEYITRLVVVPALLHLEKPQPLRRHPTLCCEEKDGEGRGHDKEARAVGDEVVAGFWDEVGIVEEWERMQGGDAAELVVLAGNTVRNEPEGGGVLGDDGGGLCARARSTEGEER